VCELDTIYGVTRHYFTSVVKPHGGTGRSGFDAVPNIDQRTSAFDAANFRGYLLAPHSGKFSFVVEVVGRFLFSFRDKVLLTGRSYEAKPKRFKSGDVVLTDQEYCEVQLQYVLDPSMTSVADIAPVPRHLRLLWESDTFPLSVVPPVALRHSLNPLYGFPHTAILVNDHSPCDSKNVVKLEKMKIGANGSLTSGSPNKHYNSNLNCRWLLTTELTSRINFFANFFDVQASDGCRADRIEFRLGLNGEVTDTLCGKRSGYIASKKGTAFAFFFVTDDAFEGAGFDITYEVLDPDTKDPTLVVQPR
jgi:hypothetical protein